MDSRCSLVCTIVGLLEPRRVSSSPRACEHAWFCLRCNPTRSRRVGPTVAGVCRPKVALRYQLPRGGGVRRSLLEERPTAHPLTDAVTSSWLPFKTRLGLSSTVDAIAAAWARSTWALGLALAVINSLYRFFPPSVYGGSPRFWSQFSLFSPYLYGSFRLLWLGFLSNDTHCSLGAARAHMLLEATSSA